MKTMRFEAREITPFARPVSARLLQAGHVYFLVNFVDPEMLIPAIEPLIYLGEDLEQTGEALWYFQDAPSYRAGIRFDDTPAEFGEIHTFPVAAETPVYDFEAALDLILLCALHRRAGH
jgi:hypothetical protein